MRPNYTVFLKERTDNLVNLKGDECIVSGITMDKEGKRMIVYYSNCDVHDLKLFDEVEIKQWLEPKKEIK